MTASVRAPALDAGLRDVVAPERVLTDPATTERYLRDCADDAGHGRALAVVRPRDTSEVAAVVRYAAEHAIPVVPRGAGTGLSGGANAVDGCIVLCTEGMDRVLDVDVDERLAVVQPGVVNADLRERCAAHGLWYPPDPSSAVWSTIGGNVATNAGGMCCVKYGVTRDYVLGLEMVTARGEVVRIGRRTAKGVAGYDLVGLVVGSEGTLGVVTEVTLRLRPERPAERTVAGFFSSVVDAGRAVAAVDACGVAPSALELIDRRCLEAVDEWRNMGLSSEGDVLLLARCDAPGEAGQQEAERVAAAFTSAGATWASVSTDEAEAEALFEARRLAYPALARHGEIVTEDVCVPRTAVPEMLARVERAGREHGVTVANVAHAGDGNLHPMLLVPPGDTTARERAGVVFEAILSDALALGGTVTGEHGVGLLKRGGLRRELSPEVLALHREVKRAFDPANILNPGKIFDGPAGTGS